MFARDTTNGDTALHLACRNRNVDIVKLILTNSESQKCLLQNYKG
jgi:ankyrin repeat protein